MRTAASALALAFFAFSLLLAVRAQAETDVDAVPVLRLAAGPGVEVQPDTKALFAFETTLGLTWLRDVEGSVAFNAEGGYTFDTGGERGPLHAGNFTLGIGWGEVGMALMYQPRFIIGSYDADLAIGMRNGVTFHLIADLASIEIGHQFLSVREIGEVGADPSGRGLRHDVRLMLGVNPAAVLYLLAAGLDAAY